MKLAKLSLTREDGKDKLEVKHVAVAHDGSARMMRTQPSGTGVRGPRGKGYVVLLSVACCFLSSEC